MTIEAVVFNYWPSGRPNLLHHRSFEGYCENIPQGAVRVELWVGQCSGGWTLGEKKKKKKKKKCYRGNPRRQNILENL